MGHGDPDNTPRQVFREKNLVILAHSLLEYRSKKIQTDRQMATIPREVPEHQILWSLFLSFSCYGRKVVYIYNEIHKVDFVTLKVD